MGSEKREDPMNNTAGTDEETIAQRRKRLRRVSFADREITSVHIFNRDEDYETPPISSASKPQNGEQADTSESEDKVIRFFGELADNEDTEGGGDDGEDEIVAEKSFLRPKGSPSSGGSTNCSATSDEDEDNFFGPVSSHFINPGRLSDTTISEEHHDITMDSTAFSMHFRSIARSESGDVKTPTSSHLPVEDKTPTQVTSISDTGHAMVLTEPKKLFSKSPLSIDKRSGGGDSNDMSIVGENSGKYDYGYISPTLAALLGDESKDFPSASSEKIVKASPDFSLFPQNGCIPRGHAYKDSRDLDSNDACQMLSPYGSGCHPQIVLWESGSQGYVKEASLSSSLVGIVPQSFSCVTPSPKQGGSFMSRETLALVESTIKKSNSRLEMIPSSPVSALLQRIENSKLQLSKCRSMTTPSTIGRKEVGFRQEKHADVPITNLEDLLSEHDSGTPISEKRGITVQRSCDALSPAVNTSDVFACRSPEGNTSFEMEGSLLKQQQRNQSASTPGKFVSSLANSSNTTEKGSLLKQGQINETASPPKKSVSSPGSMSKAMTPELENFGTPHDQEQQSKAIRNSETGSGNVTEDCASNDSINTLSYNVDSLLPESGVLLSETGFLNGSVQQGQINETASPPEKSVPSPGSMSKEKGSLLKKGKINETASPPEKSVSSLANLSNTTKKGSLLTQGQINETSSPPEKSVSSPGSMSKEKGSLLKQGQINETASPPEKSVSSPGSMSKAMIPELENFGTPHDQEQQSKAIKNSETWSGNVTKDYASNDSMNTLSYKVDSLLAESGVLLSETGFLNGSAQQKEKDSVLNKHQNGTNNIGAAQFLLKDMNHVEVYSQTELVSTENFPSVSLMTENIPGTTGSSSLDRSKNEAPNAKEPSILKRKAKDVDLGVRNCSPKFRKGAQYISSPVMDHANADYDGDDCDIVREQILNRVEIPGKVSLEINQIFATLADKLNSRLICKLEDILTHLKKVHLCEMHCLQIQSQKVGDDLSASKAKRRAESRSLVCKLAYEKAKLELLHVKQQILMKKYQAVNTGVQTSEILRSNCAKLLSQHSFLSTGLLNLEQAHEVATSKEAEITEETQLLDSKIKNLIKCFPTCDKMTGEQTYADTILTAEDILKKKMSCRFIRQEILVWKGHGLGECSDCQSIVLNYIGLINQRLTLKPGQASSVLISNSFSDTCIKKFPDMNISTAFNSLFNTEYSKKYVGGLLLEITQETSLLLHNLLDVAEELQLARMEIPNLVQVNFDSPSVEQLHLRICFIDCKNMRKVTTILDVTCLTHGKYPGEVTPHELFEVSGTKGDCVGVSKQVMNEIESAMVDVGVGYPRILRLCRCISNVLRSLRISLIS